MSIPSQNLQISRYKGGRHWAVRESDTGFLVAVTVYRKGAIEVVRRITGITPVVPKRSREKPEDFEYRAGGKP